jgi:hypothetical protein
MERHANTKKLLGGALIALVAVLASGFLTPLTTVVQPLHLDGVCNDGVSDNRDG